MLASDLLQAIVTAYRLAVPKQFEPIHDGSNQVYKFNYPSGSAHTPLAIKVSSLSAQCNITSKTTEWFTLQRLQSLFPFAPTIISPDTINPDVAPEQTQGFDWGLLWRQQKIVSVYPWITSVPYCERKQQLSQAGKSVAQLQIALHAVSRSASNFGSIEPSIVSHQPRPTGAGR